MKKILFFILLALSFISVKAENGYRLWLRYDLISDQQLLTEYNNLIKGFMIGGNSSTIVAAKYELQMGTVYYLSELQITYRCSQN